jgi:hypothetical protein
LAVKKSSITVLILGAIAFALSAQPIRAQVGVSVTIGGFHDEMAPYGRWVDCRYGQCWVPQRVSAHWQPYTNGQWVYTEYGWTWRSDDPWGGNPYHYGTWASLDHYGWCWIPGTVWAPAWVTWSYSNSYVGWAPLPPTVVFGASGYAGSAIVVSPAQYVFVPTNRFVGSNVASVRVPALQNATIFRQTTPVTRFSVSGGILRNTAIPVATIQRASGVRVESHNIGDARATPRSMTAGTTGGNRRVAIVAPSREIKAASKSKSMPQAISRSAGPAGEKHGKQQAKRESRSAMPQSRQSSTVQRAAVKPQHQERSAPKAHETSPARSHGQATQASAQPRKETQRAPARAEARPSEPRHAAAPVQHRQEPPARANAGPRNQQQASAHSSPPAPTKQGVKNEKPAKKDKSDGKP